MENPEALLEIMDKELYSAAMKGNVKFLEKIQSDEYLLRKTQKKNNIIHTAIRSQRLEFLEAILRRFPNNRELICEENSEKNTPLHIAAEVGNVVIGSLIYGHLEKMMTKIEGDDEKPLWRSKNIKGNNLVHHAIINANLDFAMWFLEKDPGFATIVNGSDQAPLHLAVKHFVDDVENDSIKTRIKHGEARSTTSNGCEDQYIKSKSIISKLLLIAGHVACWHDENGMTPLHRASWLRIPHNVEITRFIIQQWPQSAEECDYSGKTILHLLINKTIDYLECKNLLRVEEIHNLRNCQDHQGNTPLHIATEKMDTNMARVLVEFETNLNITNMEGNTATFFIQQQHMMEMLQKGKMTREESEAADKADIEFLKERLKTIGADFLRSRDSNGENILHKLFKVYNVPVVMGDFIKQILSLNQTLLDEIDINGDNPIHILVRQEGESSNRVTELLDICARFIAEMEEETRNKGIRYDPPWIVQNADGDTPLLAALSIHNHSSSHESVVKDLISYYPRAIRQPTNKHGENAFHLIKNNWKILDKMIEEGTEQVAGISERDKNGVTPIKRALLGGWEFQATKLLQVEKLDRLSNLTRREDAVDCLCIAIENMQFDFLECFFDKFEYFYTYDFFSRREVEGLPLFFNTQTLKGKKPSYLLGEVDTFPPYLTKRLHRYPELRGIRSKWDIPRSQLQNYMSSMNVIAALLTTITFTAAFTVPGGLDQEKGTPLLMSSIAFQVFIVSDVIAMCLSMMVLFCLLWIVATNNRDRVRIQDFAVSLLLASFVATLVTFMMGVYATIFDVKPGIAIATLVLCSILMLLVHRFMLTKVFLPLMIAIHHPIYTISIMCGFAIDIICPYIVFPILFVCGKVSL